MLGVVEVKSNSVDFSVEALATTNLTNEYGVVFDTGEEVSFYSTSLPNNWNPDQFAIMKFGRILFDSNDNLNHYLFNAYGDQYNHVYLYKSSGNEVVCDYTYAGKTYSASTTYTFSSGTTIFIGVYLPDFGERLTLYIDNDADNVLETVSTSERIGVFYPYISNGLVELVYEDMGYRFNVSGGVTNVVSGTGYAGLITRDGLFSLVEEA